MCLPEIAESCRRNGRSCRRNERSRREGEHRQEKLPGGGCSQQHATDPMQQSPESRRGEEDCRRNRDGVRRAVAGMKKKEARE